MLVPASGESLWHHRESLQFLAAGASEGLKHYRRVALSRVDWNKHEKKHYMLILMELQGLLAPGMTVLTVLTTPLQMYLTAPGCLMTHYSAIHD